MTLEEKLEFCAETAGKICRSHFYNEHNDLGIKHCWHLESAQLRQIHIYRSPSDVRPIHVMTLSCFQPENDHAKWLKDAGLVAEGARRVRPA